MKFSVWVLLVCFVFSGLSPIFAGGAIDLVAMKKQEEERRKKIAKSKQAINDSNVNIISGSGKSYGFVQMESETPPAEEKISAMESEAPSTSENISPDIADSENQAVEQMQPDSWKKKLLELQERIAQLKESINIEQNELNKLWADFYIKNIPAEQSAIKVQISQLTNQIEQKKLFLGQTETQLVEFYEKARKAGVPPGWLR